MKLNILKGKHRWNYPVIQDYMNLPPVYYYNDGHSRVTIHVLQQDGIWCAGRSYNVDGFGFGGGCAPGRKWGEWDNSREPLIYVLEELLRIFIKEIENNDNSSVKVKAKKVVFDIRKKLLVMRSEQLSFKFE